MSHDPLAWFAMPSARPPSGAASVLVAERPPHPLLRPSIVAGGSASEAGPGKASRGTYSVGLTPPAGRRRGCLSLFWLWAYHYLHRGAQTLARVSTQLYGFVQWKQALLERSPLTLVLGPLLSRPTRTQGSHRTPCGRRANSWQGRDDPRTRRIM